METSLDSSQLFSLKRNHLFFELRVECLLLHDRLDYDSYLHPIAYPRPRNRASLTLAAVENHHPGSRGKIRWHAPRKPPLDSIALHPILPTCSSHLFPSVCTYPSLPLYTTTPKQPTIPFYFPSVFYQSSPLLFPLLFSSLSLFFSLSLPPSSSLNL